MGPGSINTFGNNKASQILWVESNKNEYDLHKVSRILHGYNIKFKEIENSDIL